MSPAAEKAIWPQDSTPPRVAYVMSRFPKLSETFILFEMVAVRELGIAVELYPLLRQPESVVHPEARAFIDRAHYIPFASWAVARSQLHWLRTRPRAYLGALAALLRGTAGSVNFFVGALGIFPKTAHAAHLMERQGVTHVHCHFANHPAAAGFVITRLTGLPYSFVAHGSDLHVDRHMLPQKVAEAAFVVAVSEYNRELILAECRRRSVAAEGKVIVVHCGVDTEVFTPRPVDVSERADRPFTIACIATIHEVKGQDYLVEACRRLCDDGLDVRCRLVGDGPGLQSLKRRVAAEGMQARVHFEGRLTRPQVIELLSEIDVLAAPSVPTRTGKREGIPVALMEAMSAGVPVVASAISGIPELVRDEVNGLLVPPRDPAALAAALRRMHDDPVLRGRLAASGRATVVADFNLRRSAVRLAASFTTSGVPAA
jgi:colanic acid/amylovoran biosynthesis glycosyltransferase